MLKHFPYFLFYSYKYLILSLTRKYILLREYVSLLPQLVRPASYRSHQLVKGRKHTPVTGYTSSSLTAWVLSLSLPPPLHWSASSSVIVADLIIGIARRLQISSSVSHTASRSYPTDLTTSSLTHEPTNTLFHSHSHLCLATRYLTLHCSECGWWVVTDFFSFGYGEFQLVIVLFSFFLLWWAYLISSSGFEIIFLCKFGWILVDLGCGHGD